MAPGAPPLDSFHTDRVVDGVTVRTAHPHGGPTWGQAEAHLPFTPQAILAHLVDFERLVGRVPRLARVRVMSRARGGEGAGEAVVYFLFHLPWPVSDREYTARYQWSHAPDGVITVRQEDANSLGPPRAAVRVTGLHGLFTLMPEGDGSRVRYLFTADFGGLLPRAVKQETLWRQPLETLRGIRDALARSGSAR